MTEEIMNAAKEGIAAKYLPKIAGFQTDLAHRVVLIGLHPRAPIGNAKRSLERIEVLREISERFTKGYD